MASWTDLEFELVVRDSTNKGVVAGRLPQQKNAITWGLHDIVSRDLKEQNIWFPKLGLQDLRRLSSKAEVWEAWE